MKKFTIGIIREEKIPPDNRAPLTPRQCHELSLMYPRIDIRIEKSIVRCFSDDDYWKFGIGIIENPDQCDVLLGIKEVPAYKLIPGKIYVFFSHTIKMQERNKDMLRAILDKKIRLIDYELITDESSRRLIGFGRWAGIVGAHYALLMLGKRTQLFDLKPASNCLNFQELIDQYDDIKFPPSRFVITGGGRVAQGAIEIMNHAKITEVSKEDYLNRTFDKPVFVQLHSRDIYRHKYNSDFIDAHYYKNAGEYESNFRPFLSKTDVLINCIYWDIHSPKLFEEQDTKAAEFAIKTIADISCDIPGSIPITLKTTTTNDPVYGYYPADIAIGSPYQPGSIDVMAIPNLPNELPKDASRDFGKIILETVLPAIINNPDKPLLERATITKNGKLTARFEYLKDWVER